MDDTTALHKALIMAKLKKTFEQITVIVSGAYDDALNIDLTDEQFISACIDLYQEESEK